MYNPELILEKMTEKWYVQRLESVLNNESLNFFCDFKLKRFNQSRPVSVKKIGYLSKVHFVVPVDYWGKIKKKTKTKTKQNKTKNKQKKNRTNTWTLLEDWNNFEIWKRYWYQ